MKTMQIKLDDDVHRRAKVAAYQLGVTLAEFVRRAIQVSVEHDEDDEPCPESGCRRLQ